LSNFAKSSTYLAALLIRLAVAVETLRRTPNRDCVLFFAPYSNLPIAGVNTPAIVVSHSGDVRKWIHCNLFHRETSFVYLKHLRTEDVKKSCKSQCFDQDHCCCNSNHLDQNINFWTSTNLACYSTILLRNVLLLKKKETFMKLSTMAL